MTATPAIDEKVLVGREHLGRVGQFRHSHKARVGQTHRLVSVFPEKSTDICAMVRDREVQPDDPSLDQTQQRFGVAPVRLEQKDGSDSTASQVNSGS